MAARTPSGTTPSGTTPPATGAPRRPRGEATRTRLVAAGLRTFPRKGFHATRVDDIVRSARTSHGTFYLYFSSKDDLFEHLVTEVAGHFASLNDDLPEIRDDPAGAAALREWISSFVELYAKYGPLIRSWTDAESPGIDSGLPDLVGGLADGLAARLRVRATTRFDPGVAAVAVVAMLERLNYLMGTGQVGTSVEDVVDVMVATSMDAFFGPGHR